MADKELIKILTDIRDQLRRSNEHRVSLTDAIDLNAQAIGEINETLKEIKYHIKKVK